MDRIYVMLFVSVFTFIGLPCAQTITSFSNPLDEKNFSFDLSSEEEESENSENETKELEQKLVHQRNGIALVFFNKLSAIALHEHINAYCSLIFEVSTPPPKR